LTRTAAGAAPADLRRRSPFATTNKLAVGSATLNPLASLIIEDGTQLYMNGASQTIAGIQVRGTGNSENRGAIRAQSGTLTSAISLQGSTMIGAEGGTIAGTITSGSFGTQFLTVGGAANGNLTLAATIGGGTGVISLLNATTGTTRLTRANTYTGNTVVSAGTLLVNNATGSGTGTGSVTTVGIGSTLGGTGTVAGNTTISGSAVLSPGDPLTGGLGSIRFNSDLTLDTSASMLFELNAGGTDHVSVGGKLSLDTSSLITVMLNYIPSSSITFDLLGSYRLVFTFFGVISVLSAGLLWLAKKPPLPARANQGQAALARL